MKIRISLSSVDYDVANTDRSKYVSDECHRHILRSVGGVFILFPGMRSWFKGVRYTKKLTSSFDPFDRKLVISTYGLDGTVGQANEILSKANKPGFSVFQQHAFDSLIIHETGHAVDHWIRFKHRNDDEALTQYAEDKKQLFAQLPPPSEYAKKNQQEFFAEQFAQDHMGKGERYLINMLLKWRDK